MQNQSMVVGKGKGGPFREKKNKSVIYVYGIPCFPYYIIALERGVGFLTRVSLSYR